MFASVLQTSTRRAPQPHAYGYRITQKLLTFKSVYRLPSRALQGFAISLRRLALPTLPVLHNVGEAVYLLVNSTGLKLFGKGEWKVRRHGYSRRRGWCKVKDASTGQACAPRMTHRDVDDANFLPELLAQIRPATKVEVVRGDGVYVYTRRRSRCSVAHDQPHAGVHTPEIRAGGLKTGHRASLAIRWDVCNNGYRRFGHRRVANAIHYWPKRGPVRKKSISSGVLIRPSAALRYGKRPNRVMMP